MGSRKTSIWFPRNESGLTDSRKTTAGTVSWRSITFEAIRADSSVKSSAAPSGGRLSQIPGSDERNCFLPVAGRELDRQPSELRQGRRIRERAKESSPRIHREAPDFLPGALLRTEDGLLDHSPAIHPEAGGQEETPQGERQQGETHQPPPGASAVPACEHGCSGHYNEEEDGGQGPFPGRMRRPFENLRGIP